jgi:hypothetical protein
MSPERPIWSSALEGRLYLLFAVDEPDPDAAVAVASLVHELNRERAWSGGDIMLVDEKDASSVSQPGDEPIWTLGGALTLARPSEDLRHERVQLEEAELLIERLCRFSGGGHSLVVEYDGEEVGVITDGRADSSLREGLLGEWRKRLREP